MLGRIKTRGIHGSAQPTPPTRGTHGSTGGHRPPPHLLPPLHVGQLLTAPSPAAPLLLLSNVGLGARCRVGVRGEDWWGGGRSRCPPPLSSAGASRAAPHGGRQRRPHLLTCTCGVCGMHCGAVEVSGWGRPRVGLGGALTCLAFSSGCVQPRARIHEVTDGEQPAAAVTGAEHSVLRAEGTGLAHSTARGCIRPPAWPPRGTAALWGAATIPTAPRERSEHGVCILRGCGTSLRCCWASHMSVWGSGRAGGGYLYGGGCTRGGCAWH